MAPAKKTQLGEMLEKVFLIKSGRLSDFANKLSFLYTANVLLLFSGARTLFIFIFNEKSDESPMHCWAPKYFHSEYHRISVFTYVSAAECFLFVYYVYIACAPQVTYWSKFETSLLSVDVRTPCNMISVFMCRIRVLMFSSI